MAGYDPKEGWPGQKTLRREMASLKDDEALVVLAQTPLGAFLQSNMTISLSARLRNEHTHFVAPSGSGKTRSLEYLIHYDLAEVAQGKRSVIVMESEGKLVRRLARHPLFDERNEDNIADRLYLIDPGLSGCLPGFSFFNLLGRSFADMSDLEREQISNQVVDLYRYVFRALRGGELTENQGYLFNHLVRMLIWVDGATLKTLLQCLHDPDEAIRLSAQAPEKTQEFFREIYPDKRFAARRLELYQRLDSFVTEADIFRRMVSAPHNTFDLLSAINRGSVILINTSKEILINESSQIFGRFMLALLRLVSLFRDEQDTLTLFYIDEAQEYMDEKARELFEQVRKRSIGLIVAHQELSQLSPHLKQSIKTNTQTVFCGDGDYHDRREMARNMDTRPEFFKRLVKRDMQDTQFGFWGRGITPNGAVRVTIPTGTLEQVGLSDQYPKGRWPTAKPVRLNPSPDPEEKEVWVRVEKPE